MKSSWLLAFTILAACYDPNLAGGLFRCSDVNPICPDGQMCSNGFCVNPGETVDAATSGPVPDLTTMPPPGPKSVTGCKNPGYDLGQNGMGMHAYACPGRFDNPGGRGSLEGILCNNGATLCVRGGIALTQSEIDQCNILPNFFAFQFNNHLYYQPPQTPDQVNCSNPMGTREAFPGCGGLMAGQTMNMGVYRLKNPCSGFNNLNDLDCASAQQQQWNCNGNGSDLWDTTNNNSQDGILCCK